MNDVSFLRPTYEAAWREFPLSHKAELLRRGISGSSHVLVVAVAESHAAGIEAEHARSLGKPIAVWYSRHMNQSDVLNGIAAVHSSEDEENIALFLDRFREGTSVFERV